MTEMMRSVTATNIRYRINISTTSKGLPSWECTIDSQDSGASVSRIEAELHKLVLRLSSRYPAGKTLEDIHAYEARLNEIISDSTQL